MLEFLLKFHLSIIYSNSIYPSFLLHSDSIRVATDSGVRTHRKTNFCVPVGISSGCPMPLGFSRYEDGSVNFALFSRKAESVVLCLYDSNANQSCLGWSWICISIVLMISGISQWKVLETILATDIGAREKLGTMRVHSCPSGSFGSIC